jgi:hypothetical protein
MLPTLSTDIISHAIHSNLVFMSPRELWNLSLASRSIRPVALEARKKQKTVMTSLLKGLAKIWPRMMIQLKLPSAYIDTTYYVKMYEHKLIRLTLEFEPDLSFVTWKYFTVDNQYMENKEEEICGYIAGDADAFVKMIWILYTMTDPVDNWRPRFRRIYELMDNLGISFLGPDEIDDVIIACNR